MATVKPNVNSFFDSISVSIEELKWFIQDKLVTNIPLNILGATGIGKTEIVKAVAKECNAYLIDLNTTTSDVLDTGGLPFRNETDRLEFALSQTLPLMQDNFDDYKYVILFIDEMPLAARELQSVLYKMVQERMVRHTFLNEKVRIISAGNLKSDLGNHNEPPAPLKNREGHVYLRPDPVGWVEWAQKNQLHPMIINFIEGNPQYIHVLANEEHKGDYKQFTEMYAFYTPRSWSNLSVDLYHAEKMGRSVEFIHKLILSHVGTVGHLFFTFYKNALKIPSVKKIVDGEEINNVLKWRNDIYKTDYPQSMMMYLSYLMTYELSKYKIRLCDHYGDQFTYINSSNWLRATNNCFEFLDEVTEHDSALLQSFYQTFLTRFGLVHKMGEDSLLFNYLSSNEMKEFNEYQLNTGD